MFASSFPHVKARKDLGVRDDIADKAVFVGLVPKAVDPRDIKAMAETGLDVSGQKSKDVDALGNKEFDYVITLCDNAKESCPYFPAQTRLMHHGFDDPPKLAADALDEEEAMAHYRRVRDEIKAFIERLPDLLREKALDK